MILFVDDEEIAEMFLDEMRDLELPVRYFTRADKAWSFLENTRKPLDVAILDVMMPPGSLFTNAESNEGLNTGLLFLRLLRQKGYRCPVYLLTNRTDQDLMNAGYDDENAEVLVKSDLFYDDFAELVDRKYQEVRLGANEQDH